MLVLNRKQLNMKYLSILLLLLSLFKVYKFFFKISTLCLRSYFFKLLPKLKNKTLDTAELYKKTAHCKNSDRPYSLDELCDLHKMKLTDRHTALGDAYLTAILFLKI